ncbi:uncharacterized protein BDR25DRAFT_351362 [Lindgomyces ingoldianus]|uniref:Uncharacterized protein n=1 Tax=Lindgomyces ingoldianus TaxID=673940 RepID=A0ACB6R959_9PLEO|nr:uncharacterized protein BDR25DRAFT_351362 [Lindgomyces ingoldianus]KAF2474860.1 hypothetical protein BDR25DRAFT_351362 [Lindgomyces ingoldianus]
MHRKARIYILFCTQNQLLVDYSHLFGCVGAVVQRPDIDVQGKSSEEISLHIRRFCWCCSLMGLRGRMFFIKTAFDSLVPDILELVYSVCLPSKVNIVMNFSSSIYLLLIVISKHDENRIYRANGSGLLNICANLLRFNFQPFLKQRGIHAFDQSPLLRGIDMGITAQYKNALTLYLECQRCLSIEQLPQEAPAKASSCLSGFPCGCRIILYTNGFCSPVRVS